MTKTGLCDFANVSGVVHSRNFFENIRFNE
jgi:hypothetical protein